MPHLTYRMMAIFFTFVRRGINVRDHEDVDAVDELRKRFSITHLFDKRHDGINQPLTDTNASLGQDPTHLKVELDLELNKDKTGSEPDLPQALGVHPQVVPTSDPYKFVVTYAPILFSTYGMPNMVVQTGKAYYEATITNASMDGRFGYVSHCGTDNGGTGAQLGWAEDGIMSANDGFGGNALLAMYGRGVGDDPGGWSYGFCPFRLGHAYRLDLQNPQELPLGVHQFIDTKMSTGVVGSIVGVAVDWDKGRISFGITNPGEKTIWEDAYEFAHCAEDHGGVFPAFTGTCFEIEINLNPQEPSRSPGSDFKPFAEIAKRVTPTTEQNGAKKCIANKLGKPST